MSLEGRYYTADELAELFHVSTKTVFRLAREGRLASVRVGNARRFPESAVEALIARSGACRVAGSVVPIRRTG